MSILDVVLGDLEDLVVPFLVNDKILTSWFSGGNKLRSRLTNSASRFAICFKILFRKILL